MDKIAAAVEALVRYVTQAFKSDAEDVADDRDHVLEELDRIAGLVAKLSKEGAAR
jgi:hypothetical protein